MQRLATPGPAAQRPRSLASEAFAHWRTQAAYRDAKGQPLTLPRLGPQPSFESLAQARGDGSHLKALARLGKAQLLIIDDFLLTPLSEAERKDFLEVVEDRYARAATVLTSQCPSKDWHQAIGDPTLADAICDRLLHNACRIELKGESIRKNGKR